jgi:hypothetical protein
MCDVFIVFFYTDGEPVAKEVSSWPRADCKTTVLRGTSASIKKYVNEFIKAVTTPVCI